MKHFLLTILFSITFSSFLPAQNIGIGTTSPDAKLDVSATDAGILIPRVALTATNVAAPVVSPLTSTLVYNTNTAGDVTPGFYFWNDTLWVRLLTGPAALSANNGLTLTGSQLQWGGTLVQNTEVAQAGNDFRFTGTGSVGIGVSGSLSNKLHVAGGVRVESGINLNDGTEGLPAYRFNSDSDNGMWLPGANQLAFSANGAERLRINGTAADGRIGINNSSPTAALDIVRTNSTEMLTATNYANAANYDFRRSQGTVAAPTIVNNNTVIARLRGIAYDGAAFRVAGQITFETDAATGSGDMPGRIVFSTTLDGASAPTERMRITNSGDVRIAGLANGIVKAGGGNGTLSSGTVSLTTEISGILPVANGGTGVATLPANGLIIGNGTSPVVSLATGTSGQVLRSNGASAPSWANPGSLLTAGSGISISTNTITNTGVRTASNGLTVASNNVKLGGNLIENTTISRTGDWYHLRLDAGIALGSGAQLTGATNTDNRYSAAIGDNARSTGESTAIGMGNAGTSTTTSASGYSLAIGRNMTTSGGSNTTPVIGIGSGFTHNTGGSIMMAMNSSTPSIMIREGSGATPGNVGIGLSDPQSLLHVSGNTRVDGGFRGGYQLITATTSLTAADYYVHVGGGSNITITFPDPATAGAGATLYFRTQFAAGTKTFASDSGTQLRLLGASTLLASFTIVGGTNSHRGMIFISDGDNWNQISNDFD